ncbi:MAG: HisA/HisF-related TIM barrel protein [Gemmatimonadaceae bacterium]
MLAIPAIDLRDRHCVQLVGGDYDAEAVRLEDPVAVARRWVAVGFSRLHVVDLDAATGRGDNRDLVRDLLRDSTVPLQVGGGVRDESALDDLFDDGAASVVVGTRGIEDPTWLAEHAARWPGRIVLAADVRDKNVVAKGWTSRTTRRVEDVIDDLAALPLAGLLITAVHKEGKMAGPDLPLVEGAVDRAPWPVIASGGIASMQDLRNLEARGAWGAVLGMALYTGALEARLVAEEFAE